MGATIELKALSGYTFSGEYTPVLEGSAYTYIITGTGEGNRMTITAKYEKTSSESGTDKQEEESGETDGNGKSSTEAASGLADVTGQSSGNESSGEGTVSGSSSASTASSSSASTYDCSEAAAFTLSAQDNYKLSLSVDELDILSVKQGQTAKISLNAISDQEFEGTVTKVGTVGTSSGSSAKYTVEVTLPRQDNMLIGMTASATITIKEAEDAVLIPMSALQEEGGKYYVYTSKDSDGKLSNKTEVEIGLSNETQVEITDGLSEGDIVYYETASSSSSDKEEQGICDGSV